MTYYVCPSNPEHNNFSLVATCKQLYSRDGEWTLKDVYDYFEDKCEDWCGETPLDIEDMTFEEIKEQVDMEVWTEEDIKKAMEGKLE